MDGEAACAVIIQLKLSFTRSMFWAFGIWKQGWFPEHRTVSSIIFLGCFPTKVSHFLWLKHEKQFLHSAASSAPSIVLVSRNTTMAESKWRESMQLQNDKFCGNYPSRWSLKSSWFILGILNKNLEMCGMEGNTFWIMYLMGGRDRFIGRYIGLYIGRYSIEYRSIPDRV